nr:hypothetical protein [uncultured Ruminococcus sp.]
MKKLLSLFLALALVISTVATFSAEEEKAFDGYIYMTVERNTLGQGFVQEPIKVGYYEGDSLADITERMLGDRSTFTGDISNYYLEGIKDGGEPENWTSDEIPSDIKKALGENVNGRTKDDVLQAFDYTSYSGWMFTVDNKGIDVGAGGVSYADKADTTHYTDGSVVRLQYTLYGYGEDVGISWGMMNFDTTNKFVDRSELIRYIADINDENTQSEYGTAYTDAVKLLNTWNVTEEQIDNAIKALDATQESTPDEDTRNVEWAGAMNNFKDGNQVTDTKVVKNNPEEKWSYELNRTKGSWGSYYAGQSVIVDDYLYATGGGNLHKVDTKTGKGETVAVAGSTAFYYDYVAYGDGMIFVSTSSDIEAFDIDTLQSLGKVKGTFNQYHPMQYNKGYLVCNGNIYKVNKNSDNVLTQVGEGTIGGDSFNWSQGVFANNYYYVVATNDIYCVDYKTNTIKYQYKYDENRTTTYNIGGELAYDSTTDYLYWGSYKQKNLHAVKLNDNGDFDKETYKSATISQESVCAPVVYNNRIYVAGQGGTIDVINGNPDDNDFLSTIYTTNKIGMKIQSNPILSTGYEEETGNVYIYVQSYNAPGNIYYLEDNENSTSGTLKQLSNLSTKSTAAYAYEQIAIDDEGQIYFFNEEGYLYCYGEKHIHNYTYKTLLNGKHIKTCDGCGESEEEFCTFENDKCIYCGVKRSNYIYGDINQDGEVTVQDVTLLQKYVTKLAELNDVQKECAMFDHMDKITVKSATKIQKYIANPELDTLVGASFYMYSK